MNYRIILPLLLRCMIGNGFYVQCAAPEPFVDHTLLNFNPQQQDVSKKKREDVLQKYVTSTTVGTMLGLGTAVGSNYVGRSIWYPINWFVWMIIREKSIDIISQDLIKKNIDHDKKIISVAASVADGVGYFVLLSYFNNLMDNE